MQLAEGLHTQGAEGCARLGRPGPPYIWCNLPSSSTFS